MSDIIHIAAYGTPADLKAAIASGADVNFVEEAPPGCGSAATEYGNTPLHYAKNAEMAKILLEAGAFIDIKNYAGCTAIMDLESKYNNPFLARLVDACNHPKDYADTTVLGPLRIFWRKLKRFNEKRNGLKMLKFLKSAEKSGKYLRCPFYLAAEGDIEGLRQEIKKGTDINNCVKGSVLGAAIKADDLQMMRLIIDNGGDVSDPYLLFLCRSPQACDLLLEHGASMESVWNSDTPLTKHAKYDLIITEHLILKGANVNHQDKYGNTCLINTVTFVYREDEDYRHMGKYALFKQQEKVIRLLKEKGADFNLKDHEGRTALQRAAGHEKLTKILLECGALPDGSDDD